jgi:hypothetical protein
MKLRNAWIAALHGPQAPHETISSLRARRDKTRRAKFYSVAAHSDDFASDSKESTCLAAITTRSGHTSASPVLVAVNNFRKSNVLTRITLDVKQKNNPRGSSPVPRFMFNGVIEDKAGSSSP